MSDSQSSEQENQSEDQDKTADSTDSKDSAASEEEQYLITIDSRILQKEFARLENENEEWNRQFSSRVGTAAAAKNKPLIDQHERDLASLKSENFKNRVKAMSDEDLEKAVETDEDFSQRYHDSKFTKPNTDKIQKDLEETLVFESFQNSLAFGRASGLDETAISEIESKARNGFYSNSGETQLESLNKIQGDINRKIISSNKDTATNSSLTKAGPDTTNRSKGSGVSEDLPETTEEFNRLPWAKQQAIVSTPEGKQAVIDLK